MNESGPFAAELAEIERAGLSRFLRALPGVGGRVAVNGRELLNFSSNDYLNLASDPRLKKAAQGAIEEHGCGATASRLMAGHLALHEELEKGLAGLVGKETALVFSSGYQTNVGVLSVLGREGDAIFSDALNHASIVDGCRLSHAETCIYRHCDMAHLEELLASTDTGGRKIIVSDSVFSMDGDFAPLAELSALARQHGALLAVDEAHAIGVFGDGGGLCRELGVDADVVVGTMSKSLGGGGGFAAGTETFRRLLVNKARSFIFSTGLAPGCVGSALAGLDILGSSPDLGRNLLALSDRFRAILRERDFEIHDGASQIIPIMVGDNEAAVEMVRPCLEQGVLVTAIRPPTVPRGTARLRLSVTLAHTEQDFLHASKVLAAAGIEAGVL